MNRRAFTFPELLAVLCIVVLLLATFVPYALSLREANNRVRCVANLNNIWWALDQYQNANGHAYPRVRFDERLGNRWTAFTGADDADPFAAGSAVQPNDVSAALWLLVRTVDAKPEWFVCPSSVGRPDRLVDAGGQPVAAKARGNFRGPEHLTYGIASPYSAVPDYALNDTLPATFVLVADQGPSAAMLAPGLLPRHDAGPRTLAMGNSVNHRRAGQNVLYASGTVAFESSPYSGVRPQPSGPATTRPVPGDNIYTALGPVPPADARSAHAEPGIAGLNVGPSYRYDTYLVPGADFAALVAMTSQPAATRSTPTAPVAAPPAATASPATQVVPPATLPVSTRPTTAPTPAATREAATAPATTQAQ